MIADRPNRFGTRALLGVLLVVFGVAWTLDNLGYSQLASILGWWPVVMLAYGVAKVTGLGLGRNTITGSFFVLLGSVLLANHLGWLRFGWGLFWPLCLIFAGVNVLVRQSHLSDGAHEGEGAEDWIRAFALVGSERRRSQSGALRGGELSAVMGAVSLDLREAKPASERVVVDAFVMWGGIEIVVPESWAVEVESAAVLGAIDDQRRVPPGVTPTATLVVRGLAMMGGVTITDTPSMHRTHVGVHVRGSRRRRREEVHVTRDGITIIRTRRGGRDEDDASGGSPESGGASPTDTH